MAMIRMAISPCHRWSSWLTMQHHCIAARCHIRQLSWVKAADSASSETKNKAQQCTATGECRSMACLMYKYIVTACTPQYIHTTETKKQTSKQASKHTYIHTCMHTYVHKYINTYIHTLHYITLPYLTIHYMTLHDITLHNMTLHYNPYIHT